MKKVLLIIFRYFIFYTCYLEYHTLCYRLIEEVSTESRLINETFKFNSIETKLNLLSNNETITSAVTPIYCNLDSDCTNGFFCIENKCLNISSPTVKSGSGDYIKPYLWIILVGLPFIMLVTIIAAFMLYHNKTYCKKFLRYRRKINLQPEIELSTTISTSANISLNESTNQRDRCTPPPFYNEIICTNTEGHNDRNNSLHNNKDLFNLSMEQLPNYSSWSKKTNQKAYTNEK
jgi:hypothetical protein